MCWMNFGGFCRFFLRGLFCNLLSQKERSGPIQDNPPYLAILFLESQIASRRGSRTVFPSFSLGIAEASLRHTFRGVGRWGIGPHLGPFQNGSPTKLKGLKKRGGYCTLLRVLRRILRNQNPHSAQSGGIAEIVSQ